MQIQPPVHDHRRRTAIRIAVNSIFANYTLKHEGELSRETEFRNRGDGSVQLGNDTPIQRDSAEWRS